MFLHQLVLLSFSLLVHFMYTNGNFMEKQRKYLQNRNSFVGNNPFCEIDKKTYVGYCEIAFNKLRKIKGNNIYKYAYVDYYQIGQLYVQNTICNYKYVTIIDEELTVERLIIQEMAVCPGRPIATIIRNNQEVNKIQNDILIYMFNKFMVIFQWMDDIIHVFKTLDDVEKPDPDSIHDALFINPQPYVLNTMSSRVYLNILLLVGEDNIIKELDRHQLRKLCIAAVESDSDFQFTTSKTLYDKETKLIRRVDVVFLPINLKQEAPITARLNHVHICRGHKQEGNYKLDSMHYAIARGSDEHAVTVYQYMSEIPNVPSKQNGAHVFVKEIINVYKEFLDKIE